MSCIKKKCFLNLNPRNVIYNVRKNNSLSDFIITREVDTGYLINGSQHLRSTGHSCCALAKERYTLLQLLNDFLGLVVIFTKSC